MKNRSPLRIQQDKWITQNSKFELKRTLTCRMLYVMGTLGNGMSRTSAPYGMLYNTLMNLFPYSLLDYFKTVFHLPCIQFYGFCEAQQHLDKLLVQDSVGEVQLVDCYQLPSTIPETILITNKPRTAKVGAISKAQN